MPSATRHLTVGGEGVDFLGFHHRLVRSRATRGTGTVMSFGSGQWGGADLMAYSLVGPSGLRPVAIEVARPDHDSGEVSAVGESAAEARVDANVHEYAVGAQDPCGLPQDRWVPGHVRMGHHADGRWDRAVPDWHALSVGLRDGQAPPGVTEHPSRKVDADWGPAQLAQTRGVNAGAAAYVQANAAASSQKISQRPIDAEGVGVVV